MSNSDYIVMDCATQCSSDEVGGWNNIELMKLASCVTYDSSLDSYEFWAEEDHNKLLSYLNNKVVISYNGICFDSIILLGNEREISLSGYTKNKNKNIGWYNVDIYVEMWRRIMGMDKSNYPKIIEELGKQRPARGIFNLDSVVNNTIHKNKNGHSEDAPKLYKQKEFFKLLQYNLHDVRLTRDLYLFIKKFRYLVTGSYDIVQF